MPSPPVEELLNHLANRGDVLKCLDNGIYGSHDISEEVGKSRSSVDRDIRLLTDDDYVFERPDGYKPTKYGEFALNVYQLANQLGSAKQLVLHLPQHAPVTLIRDGNIEEARGVLPNEPIEHIVDLIEAARHIKMISPVVIPDIVDCVFEQVRNGHLTGDLIATSEVADELLTTYSEETRASLQSEDCTLWKYEGNLLFGLVLLDNKIACLVVFDDSMRLFGTVTNRSAEVIEWSLDTFDEHRNHSLEVFLPNATRKGRKKDGMNSDRVERT